MISKIKKSNGGESKKTVEEFFKGGKKYPANTKYFGGPNTKSKSKTLGEIELKYISSGDSDDFFKLLEDFKDGRAFVAQVLHHQLITPEISFKDFNKISDNELRAIAKDFVSDKKDIFKYFEDTTDAEFFSDFRKAIEKCLQERMEKLLKFSESINKSLETVNVDYRNLIGNFVIPLSSIKGMVETIDLHTNHIFGSTESLDFALRDYQTAARFFSENLILQIKPLIDWIEQNKAIFDTYTNYYREFQEVYRVSEKEAIRVLRKYKWFISPSLPFDFVFKAVKIGQREGNQRKAMNKLFVDHFSKDNFENLEVFVDKWGGNPLFKPRMKILRDCISTLKNAKRSNPSNLVLPTLIAQIDGITSEFMKQEGLANPSRGKWETPSGGKIYWKDWFKHQTLNQSLLEAANDIFLNILFQRAHPGAPLDEPFTFNRHKIMHGEYLRYGRIDNTIRAFLVLDFLATLK